jgi:hypothetical protein
LIKHNVIVTLQGQELFAIAIGNRDPAAVSLGRINTATGADVILQVEFAAPEIPALTLTRSAFLQQPEVHQRLLHQVIMHHGTRRQTIDNFGKKFTCPSVVN